MHIENKRLGMTYHDLTRNELTRHGMTLREMS